jgi:hypothetical protein
MNRNQILVVNVTGEPFHPSRIYYTVLDRRGVLSTFKKLRCVDHDRERERWVWLWTAEAKKLKFPNEYGSFPPQVHPIVIGSFTFRDDGQMILDVRSPRRALHALPFFDQWVGRKLATARALRMVNRHFSFAEAPPPGIPMDSFFERDDVNVKILQEFMQALRDIKRETPDVEARNEAAQALIRKFSRRKLPEVEEMDLGEFYENGAAGLEICLGMRESMLMKR